MADAVITAANVLASAYAKRLIPTPAFSIVGDPPVAVPNVPIAGETIDAGQPVYEATDGKFYLADANAADPAYKVAGISENKALAGQPLSIVTEDPNFQPGFTAAIGDIYIVSNNAGKLCPYADKASGWRVSFLMAFYDTTHAALKIVRTDAPVA